MSHESFYYRKLESGFAALISIHSTVLGPALGGLRMRPYISTDEALNDVLRLSRGMTYKAAAAGLNLGGGKAAIIADPTLDKSPALFQDFGRMVESLNGRYITAEDVGTTVEDMGYIRQATSYVVGTAGGSGDPSPVTALGIISAMDACLDFATGKTSLAGKRVAVQGVGKVGMALAKLLYNRGATLLICDVIAERALLAKQRFAARVFDPEEFFGLDVDILAPCSLGGVLNDESIAQIKAPFIVGAANNQLLDEERHGRMLFERGIIYAPDFVANAGGLISVYSEIEGTSREVALARTRGIGSTVYRVLEIARAENIPTYQAANRLAEERLAQAR